VKRYLILVSGLFFSLVIFFGWKYRTVSAQANCEPQDNYIDVFDGRGCDDLQTAIDSVPNNTPGYTIRIHSGEHQIPNRDSYSLIVDNKSGLNFVTTDPRKFDDKDQAILIFNNTEGGLLIKNSTDITFSWIYLRGSTTNGMYAVRDSQNIEASHLTVSDTGANAVQLQDSRDLDFSGGEYTAPGRKAFDLRNIEKVHISFVKIHDSGDGIELTNSTGRIEKNLISKMNRSGISINYLDFSGGLLYIKSNTIVNVQPDNEEDAAVRIYEFNSGETYKPIKIFKNVFANSLNGVHIETTDTQKEVELTLNAFWNNQKNVINGIGPGYNKNIATNPFTHDPIGSEYRTFYLTPAYYGTNLDDLEEYMGYQSTSAGPAGSQDNCDSTDLNHDNIVDLEDYGILAAKFLTVCQ